MNGWGLRVRDKSQIAGLPREIQFSTVQTSLERSPRGRMTFLFGQEGHQMSRVVVVDDEETVVQSTHKKEVGENEPRAIGGTRTGSGNGKRDGPSEKEVC